MRLLFALFFAVFVCMPELASAQARGRVVEVEVPAPSLAGNLLGTPEVQPASVYLPPGYARGAKRYPVVYLLHGIFDGRGAWLNYIRAPEILDRLIASGRIAEVIVVMPDGLNQYGGGFYRNSPVSGRWGDFIADDLRQFIDQRYRTLARPGARAVVGWSMGGYGAIHLAMDRPELYAAAYGISPCCLAPIDDLGLGNTAWARTLAFASPADAQAALQAGDFYPVAGLGVLSAFSPAPDAPPFFVRFPYSVTDGQISPTSGAWDRYAAEFPLAQLPEHREALAGLRVFGFDYGINDQFAHIPSSARAFSARLSELRVPHRFEVYDGDHRDHVARRLETIVLPYVVNALDGAE